MKGKLMLIFTFWKEYWKQCREWHECRTRKNNIKVVQFRTDMKMVRTENGICRMEEFSLKRNNQVEIINHNQK